jgi:hypothetical protein
MLTRNAGQIGFSRTYASPAAGGLGEGNQIDSSPGSWITLSQTDWVNGLLEDTAYAATTKFNDAIADTRYTGVLTLPPKVYGPYTTGGAVDSHITLRWLRYAQWLYCVQDGKLYRSTFDENAISGTGVGNFGANFIDVINGKSVIANWVQVSTNAIFASATDIALMEQQIRGGAYSADIIAVDGTAASSAFSTAGALIAATATFPKYLNVLDYGMIGATNSPAANPEVAFIHSSSLLNYFPVGGAVLPAGSGIYANSIVRIGTSNFVVTNRGIYALSTPSTVMTLALGLGQYESTTTGRVNCMFKGAAYFGIGDDIVKFDGTALTNVGLNRLAKVPSTVSMKARMMVATEDTLYVLTGETGKTNAIWAMTGDGIWHCLYQTASQVYSLGLDNRTGVHSVSGLTMLQLQPRLWWGIGSSTYYMYVGVNTSNISQVSPALGTKFYRGFAATGSYTTSWWGGAYQQIVKDIHGVIVGHKSWATTNATDVTADIEVDRSGTWVALTRDKYDGMQHHFISVAGTWASKTVTVGASTLSVTLDGVTGISAGTFMRIGGDVLQAKTVVGSVVTFARAANSAIAVGSIVYPAEAAGVEWRIRVSLATSDQTQTPEVLRVSTEYAYQVLAKARYTMYIKCSNEMFTNKPNGAFPYDAETYRAKLKPWITRSTPFWMMTPTGEKAMVKIINAAEAQVQDHQPAQTGKYSPSSIITVTLAEVEVKR